MLACTVMTQSHTHEYLAQMLNDIFKRFEIEHNVVRCTTDNASNFVKGFNVFGMKPELISAIAVDDEVNDNQLEKMPARSSYLRVEFEDAIEVEEDGKYEPLSEILDEVPPQDDPTKEPLYKLPAHSRCAAHTLNLVASKDVEDAYKRGRFDKNYETALAKATKIWAYHQRSDNFQKWVKELAGFKLVNPVPTRWNSTFDAVRCINKILGDPEHK